MGSTNEKGSILWGWRFSSPTGLDFNLSSATCFGKYPSQHYKNPRHLRPLVLPKKPVLPFTNGTTQHTMPL